jgi:Carboxypeptidase regulatory-like domain
LVLFTFMHAIAHAQATVQPAAYTAALPNAPQPAQSTPSTTPSNTSTPQPAAAGISGTILDTNGDVLQGATVNLLSPSGFRLHSVKSGGDGQFAFSGLSPNTYQITVTAPGMHPSASTQITLHAGEMHLVPPITLAIATNSVNVTVVGGKKALSVQQVKIAEQQRIAGVIPNFYTTYDWNAPPMEAKQKFQLGFRSVLDPVSFIAVAGVAGAEQYYNVFPEFGGGFEGYAKRYGAAFATHFASNILSSAVYPSIFHQDPRYFYKGTGSFGSRALYAISSAFIARSDTGHKMPNYSGILGNFSAAAISNLYYPASERGGSLVLFNGLADTGADAGLNLIREFILKGITTHSSREAGAGH